MTLSGELKAPFEYIALENRHGAHNYASIPVVLCRGEGPYVWDVTGKRYFDFLTCYSALSHGHCHPKIVKTLVEQASKLTLSSRAFHNDVMGPYMQYITSYFGYDKVLPMNSGAEAGETAVKLCRKWGYMKKKIPENKARILFAKNNFWGRTIAACSSSNDPDCFSNYGPFTPGLSLVPYDDLDALRREFEADAQHIAGFYVEPIQGEAGVIVPSDGYLKGVAELCKKHNVLFIADEVQTGLCRTGRILACDWEGVRPDVVVLGKALSGGMMPVSAVLADDDVMLCIKPNEHGSTYGGNPLACAVALTALQVFKEESLDKKAVSLGELFRKRMQEEAVSKYEWVVECRGRGLLNAVVIRAQAGKESKTSERTCSETSDGAHPGSENGSCLTAWEVCLALAEHGVVSKPTHENIIRFAPALTMTEAEMNEACDRIVKALQQCHSRYFN